MVPEIGYLVLLFVPQVSAFTVDIQASDLWHQVTLQQFYLSTTKVQSF
jgi:hypothetical protein